MPIYQGEPSELPRTRPVSTRTAPRVTPANAASYGIHGTPRELVNPNTTYNAALEDTSRNIVRPNALSGRAPGAAGAPLSRPAATTGTPIYTAPTPQPAAAPLLPPMEMDLPATPGMGQQGPAWGGLQQMYGSLPWMSYGSEDDEIAMLIRQLLGMGY